MQLHRRRWAVTGLLLLCFQWPWSAYASGSQTDDSQVNTPQAGTPQAGMPHAGTPHAGTPQQTESRELWTAVDWLNRMASALREESYRGTYIYIRGQQFDTMNVTHHYEDGHEYERLVSLTGTEREVIRQDAQIVPLRPEQHVTPPGIRGPFTRRFTQSLAERQAHYDFALHGVGRIADRRAMRVSIRPKNHDRHGYRLWLDYETGLLLRSNMVNRGRVLELFQFTQVDIGEGHDAESLASEIPEAVNLLAAASQDEPTPRAAANGRPGFKVDYVPSGFRQVGNATAGGMVFSDGVATLSIFFESHGGRPLGDVQTALGGTVLLSRRASDPAKQITVVGEVPMLEAKKVAESVQPVIY